MTYRLVEPTYPIIDLAKHVATQDGVRRYHLPIGSPIGHGSAIKTAASGGAHKITFSAKRLDVEEAEALGHKSLGLSHEDTRALYKAHGLTGHYDHLKDDELFREWASAKGAEKDQLGTEIHARAIAMVATLAKIQEAERLGKREHIRRKSEDHWDAVLGGSAPGRALLAIRDRLLSDKAMDRMAVAAHETREWFKETRFRIVEGKIVGWLVASVVSLAGAGAGVMAGGGAAAAEHGGDAAEHLNTAEHVAEAVHMFLENPTTEAGIAAVVGMGLALGHKIIKRQRLAKRAAEKIKAVKRAPA